MKFDHAIHVISTPSPDNITLATTAATTAFTTRYTPSRRPQCYLGIDPSTVRTRVTVALEYPVSHMVAKATTKAATTTPPVASPTVPAAPPVAPAAPTSLRSESAASISAKIRNIDISNPIYSFLNTCGGRGGGRGGGGGGRGGGGRGGRGGGGRGRGGRGGGGRGGGRVSRTGGARPSATPASPSPSPVPTTAPKQSSSTRKLPTTPSTNTLTCSVWNLRAVAPLIRWLHQQGVRYTHSDWEVQMHNGERERVISQNGTVLRDTQLLRHKSYTCYDGFRQGVWLRMTTEEEVVHTEDEGCPAYATASSSTSSSSSSSSSSSLPNRWWSVQQTPLQLPVTSDQDRPHKAPTPTRHYTDGVYHNARQHRVYAWDDSTSLHLYTTDGKHYRVVIEYLCAAGDPDPDGGAEAHRATREAGFRRLVSGVAFHFSQYVRRQRGVGE